MTRPASTAILILSLMVSAFQPTQSVAQSPQPNPVLDASKAAFEAMSEADRRGLQDALIWASDYNGLTTGVFGRQTFEGILSFQKRKGLDPTGVLSASALKALLTEGQQASKNAGFTVVDDARTGIRIGVPMRILTKSGTSPGGSRWQSADGKITLDTRNAPSEPSLQELYDRSVNSQVPGRKITYKILRPDFFVITGDTTGGKFFNRYAAGPDGIRAFSISYDKALAPTVDRLVIAIANSFTPFPDATPPAVAQSVPLPEAPQQSDAADNLLGTGFAVSPRQIITTSAIASCRAVSVAGARPQQIKGKGPFLLEFGTDLKVRPHALSGHEIVSDDSLLVIAFSKEDGDNRLVAAPGRALDATGFNAPLQQGANGAPILTGAGALAGFVAPFPQKRKIAGVIPASRYSIIPVEKVFEALPDLPRNIEAPTSQTSDMAKSVAEMRSALVPIICER